MLELETNFGILSDTTGHVYAQQFILYAAFHSLFHWVPPDFKLLQVKARHLLSTKHKTVSAGKAFVSADKVELLAATVRSIVSANFVSASKISIKQDFSELSKFFKIAVRPEPGLSAHSPLVDGCVSSPRGPNCTNTEHVWPQHASPDLDAFGR